MQFRLRTLLALTVLVAVLTMPAYRYSSELYEKWFTPTVAVVPAPTGRVVVTVPEGGTLIMGGRTYPAGVKRSPIQRFQSLCVDWIEDFQRD